ncbi:hypothetical protein ABE096_22155 [Robertmurraya massiliosenegalensis]|uniref:hypothetical protein n=1 Tax=Robertmurraya massiliosenegalensis TaxID=1287657 RepID=UPI003D2E32BD
MFEQFYGHYVTETQPDNIDKELFARTLAKVFKQLGKFMEGEGGVWKDSQDKLDKFMHQDRQITIEEANALFMQLKEEWVSKTLKE